MNTILTDDERPKLPQKVFLDNAQHHGWGHTDEALKAYADAHEAAVLAKLREQEPVMVYRGRCTVDCGEHGHHDVELLKMIPAGSNLYAAPLPAVVQVPPDLKERICEAHDASLDEDHRACRLILMECVRLIDAAAPEAPAQADPLEKLTRIQEELGLYGDKPAQAEQAAQPVRDERSAFEAWANDYALTAEPNYSQATKADCWAAFRAGATFASTERQPSVPAPWREAMKVAREALKEMISITKIHQKATGENFAWAELPEAAAALAQLDALEGGE